MITIHLLTCGEVGVDPAVPDASVSKNKLAYTGLLRSSKHRIWLPVKTFLIESPHGKVLIDTAWDSAVRKHPIKTLSFNMWFASKPRLPEGQAVDEQLATLDIKVSDLDYVIMTHMDIDHDSGLRLVKAAKHIMVSPKELDAIHSHQVRYVKRPWKNIALQTIPFTEDPQAPFGLSWDVYGDASIMVYATYGHSQGSVCIKVRGKDGFVLIVGDSGYTSASWKELKLPGPVYDKQQMTDTLKWVYSMSQDPQCKGILATHDPQETRTIIQL